MRLYRPDDEVDEDAMKQERQRLNYVLFLVTGSGLVTIARAMTLSFLAIKLQQSFGLGPAAIGALLGIGPLVGAVAASFAGSPVGQGGPQDHADAYPAFHGACADRYGIGGNRHRLLRCPDRRRGRARDL